MHPRLMNRVAHYVLTFETFALPEVTLKGKPDFAEFLTDSVPVGISFSTCELSLKLKSDCLSIHISKIGRLLNKMIKSKYNRK